MPCLVAVSGRLAGLVLAVVPDSARPSTAAGSVTAADDLAASWTGTGDRADPATQHAGEQADQIPIGLDRAPMAEIVADFHELGRRRPLQRGTPYRARRPELGARRPARLARRRPAGR